MVDAVVSFVLEKLGDYLIREAIFLGGVRSEAESLKKDLEWLLCFIKDAEEKQVDHPLIRQWVSDIRDIAYDCEDVLDEFMVKVTGGESSNVLKVEEAETSTRKQGLFTSIKKCSCLVPRTSSHNASKTSSRNEANLCSKAKEKVSLHSIGKEIEGLKKSLKEVSDRCGMYGLRDINNKWEGQSKVVREFKETRRTNSFAFEENVIGYEDDRRTLLSILLDNEPRRFAISIWGTGGLGKTTLAKKLYHNYLVRNKFQQFAWVCVSQDYNIEELIRRIINSFHFMPPTEKLEEMKEEALKRYLYTSLKESSYLVVIDDVWGKKTWGRLLEAFPNNNHCSRVIMTTRKEDVADCADHVHKLRFLTKEESWRLFCSKTFGKANETKEMVKFGKEMLKKCGGLPLAIVLLGGLLSKKSAQEWRLVRDCIWLHLNRDSDNHIYYLLSLSFNDLPYKLKPCFLYLGLFPEDYEIETRRLIRLWVAEGFIPQNEGIMEDKAHYYLNELIKRSLIQKDKMHRERTLTCRVHDLLRNLAIEKAEELNLFHIYGVNKGSTYYSRTRRLAVYSGIESNLQLQQSRVLCSLLFVDVCYTEAMEELPTVCSSFRLLTVLDIQNLSIQTMPQEMGKLIHLKYLRFSQSPLNSDVAPFILNLVNLQTLIIHHIELHPVLPTEICKLKELRHLIGRFEGYFRIGDLKNLQTMKQIPLETWIKTNPEKLVNLRELEIVGYDVKEKFCFDSIAKLRSLQFLKVYLGRSGISSLPPLSHCQNLVELTLSGKIGKLPEEMPEFFPNLEYLKLDFSEFVDDPMPTLEELPNLKVLYLGSDSYNGTKLVCSKDGFHQLEILLLFERRLQELQIEEGGMPKLRSFVSSSKAWNFRIPERLKNLPRPEKWECESYIVEEY
ncbi:disease resistance protein RPP13-like [Pistacia vera]|uniref:disease resistance protein RPP13-like n=1 Tax=Pistacia vera TaxID=55513 RepID=UPI00126344C6|nr:disease resistance protein RPP13-like [Pistacia vera]